jgi:hypothetical protein
MQVFCETNTPPEKKTCAKPSFQSTPDHEAGSESCCWIAEQRLAQRQCFVTDTGIGANTTSMSIVCDGIVYCGMVGVRVRVRVRARVRVRVRVRVLARLRVKVRVRVRHRVRVRIKDKDKGKRYEKNGQPGA